MNPRPALVVCALAIAACTAEDAPPVVQEMVSPETSLGDAFEGRFLVGTALNVGQLMRSDPGTRQAILDQVDALPQSETYNWHCIDTALDRSGWKIAGPGELDDSEFRAFILRHFNAVTGENAMKWECIHPAADTWVWDPADELTAFSNDNAIHLTGHTLVWHQQTPDWVFTDADGHRATRELLLKRMEDHISAVVGRYKGRVQSWDVVNEGIDEDGSIRSNIWQQIIGDDYIEKAFEFAHAADPDALLFYNDYNMFKPERRDATIALVKRMRAKGIPIHGIGMQGHFRVDYPTTLQSVEEAIVAYASLGLDIAITELDVSVLPWPGEKRGGADISDRHEYNMRMNPYVNGLTEDAQRTFDERYLGLFRIFLDHSNSITRVTFWGVNDAVSWRNDWPMEGRTDYPLLIDREYQLKPVVYEIVDSMRATD